MEQERHKEITGKSVVCESTCIPGEVAITMPSFHLSRYLTPYHQGLWQVVGNIWEAGTFVDQNIFRASSEAGSLQVHTSLGS